MKNVAILGSTGSIGKTALNVLSKHTDKFKIVFLANNSNETELLKQVSDYNVPSYYCKKGISVFNGIKKDFDIDLLSDPRTYSNVDIVVNGVVGIAGLAPTLAVIKAGKTLATANKESIVCYGQKIDALLKNSSSVIHPIDSEHSAVWQCIEKKENVKRIILTASGGAFRDFSFEQLKKATAIDALKHPTWVMGTKVTIDCATLVNKGMEIIEAKRLFSIDNVDAVMHRESIVHSLVEMVDGTMVAALSNPNMAIPILYALTYPDRQLSYVPFLDLIKCAQLTFNAIDEDRFPCIKICKEVSKYGDFAGTVMNASNEIAVKQFLNNKIGFYDIYDCIDSALNKFGFSGVINDVSDVYRIDKEVKEYTLYHIGEK